MFLADSLLASGANSEEEICNHSPLSSAGFEEACPPRQAPDAECIRARFFQFASQSCHDGRLLSGFTSQISGRQPQSRLHLLRRAMPTATEMGPTSRTVQEQRDEGAIRFLSGGARGHTLLTWAASVPLCACHQKSEERLVSEASYLEIESCGPITQYQDMFIQPFSQKSRTRTVTKEFQIGLYDPAEADLELLGNCWSAGILGERLYVVICRRHTTNRCR